MRLHVDGSVVRAEGKWVATASFSSADAARYKTVKEAHFNDQIPVCTDLVGLKATSIAFQGHDCASSPGSDSALAEEEPPAHKPASRLAWALRDQRLHFIGDSLSKLQWNALLIDLKFENPGIHLTSYVRYFECEKEGSCKPVSGCRGVRHKHQVLRQGQTNWEATWNCGTVKSSYIGKWNFTMSQTTVYRIPDPNDRNQATSEAPYQLMVPELFERLVQESSMVAVNVGLHYIQDKPAHFSWLLRYILGFLESDVMSSEAPKANVYRFTMPQHFTKGDFILGRGSEEHTVRHWTDIMAQGLVREFPHVWGADFFHALQDLYKFHSGRDQTHFCLSPLLHAPQWRIFEAIARHTFMR